MDLGFVIVCGKLMWFRFSETAIKEEVESISYLDGTIVRLPESPDELEGWCGESLNWKHCYTWRYKGEDIAVWDLVTL